MEFLRRHIAVVLILALAVPVVLAASDASYQTDVYLERKTGRVMSQAGGGAAYTERFHVTIAQINAGYTLLPARAGLKYRLVDVTAIAIGGNASAVTSVDVKGTQAAGAVVLASFAQASLTRSTVLRPGITGTTVLADGASFAANDVNTAITVIKAGSDIATSTHVDIILVYALDV